MIQYWASAAERSNINVGVGVLLISKSNLKAYKLPLSYNLRDYIFDLGAIVCTQQGAVLDVYICMVYILLNAPHPPLTLQTSALFAQIMSE